MALVNCSSMFQCIYIYIYIHIWYIYIYIVRSYTNSANGWLSHRMRQESGTNLYHQVFFFTSFNHLPCLQELGSHHTKRGVPRMVVRSHPFVDGFSIKKSSAASLGIPNDYGNPDHPSRCANWKSHRLRPDQHYKMGPPVFGTEFTGGL